MLEKTLFLPFLPLLPLLLPHLATSIKPSRGFLAVGGLDLCLKLEPTLLKKVWRAQHLLSSGPPTLSPVTFQLLRGKCGRPQSTWWAVSHWRVTWWKSLKHDSDKTAGSHFSNQDSCDWLTENGWEVGLTTLFNRTFHSSHTLGEISSKDNFVYQEMAAFF